MAKGPRPRPPAPRSFPKPPRVPNTYPVKPTKTETPRLPVKGGIKRV